MEEKLKRAKAENRSMNREITLTHEILGKIKEGSKLELEEKTEKHKKELEELSKEHKKDLKTEKEKGDRAKKRYLETKESLK